VQVDVVRTIVDKKPGSLLALTPLSVAMEIKENTDIVHVLVLPESIDIIQYLCIIRNWYVYVFYMWYGSQTRMNDGS
jgi:hypothetical protein